MQVELRGLQRRLGITTVMVTHDQDEALTMADRIAIMRDGYLEQTGIAGRGLSAAGLALCRQLPWCGEFFSRHGRSAAATGRCRRGRRLSLTVPVSRPIGSPVTVALRPEAMKVEPLAGADGPPPCNTVDAVIDKWSITALSATSICAGRMATR